MTESLKLGYPVGSLQSVRYAVQRMQSYPFFVRLRLLLRPRISCRCGRTLFQPFQSDQEDVDGMQSRTSECKCAVTLAYLREPRWGPQHRCGQWASGRRRRRCRRLRGAGLAAAEGSDSLIYTRSLIAVHKTEYRCGKQSPPERRDYIASPAIELPTPSCLPRLAVSSIAGRQPAWEGTAARGAPAPTGELGLPEPAVRKIHKNVCEIAWSYLCTERVAKTGPPSM